MFLYDVCFLSSERQTKSTNAKRQTQLYVKRNLINCDRSTLINIWYISCYFPCLYMSPTVYIA